LSWSETSERKIFGPDLVTEAENKVKLIQANLKAAQSRQKSYADHRRKPLQFQVGDYVYLRVSPTKDVQRFGIKGKLAPRYIGPFEITETYGLVAYKLHLPSQLVAIHDVFHISQLKKCIKAPTEVIEQQAIKWNLIYLMPNDPFKFLMPRRESLGGRISRCTKSCGTPYCRRSHLGN
jgi:hypothetical protein